MKAIEDQDTTDTITAMNLLEPAITQAMVGQTVSIRSRLNNALLNVAVNRIVEEEGQPRAATLLWRLADILTTGAVPGRNRPVEISRLHS